MSGMSAGILKYISKSVAKETDLIISKDSLYSRFEFSALALAFYLRPSEPLLETKIRFYFLIKHLF